MTRKIRITRRSKIGYGYNSGWERNKDGRDILSKPETPCHIGTIAQIAQAQHDDRTLSCLSSGGTYYTECYFARYRGQWRRIITPVWQWDLYNYPAQTVEIE